MTSLNPVPKVGYQIVEPLKLHQRMGSRDARVRAEELLEVVGIPEARVPIRGRVHLRRKQMPGRDASAGRDGWGAPHRGLLVVGIHRGVRQE